MREHVVRFWRGELPLGTSFWTYAIVYGAIAHLAGTCVALILFAFDAPAALAASVFLLPSAFSLAAAVAVWRSAGRFSGNPLWADLAKMGVVCWTVAGFAI